MRKRIPIEIAIVDDHYLLRQGLIALFKEENAIRVLFDVNNGKELLKKLNTIRPNIVLLDIEMPIMGGKETLLKVKELYPEISIIMLSMHYCDSYVTEFLLSGAKGFLQKSSDFESIVNAIYEVRETGHCFNKEISKTLISKLSSVEAAQASFYSSALTSREKEVLRLYCIGKTSIEIAQQLNISKRTVEWHKDNICVKIGTKNLIQLIVYAKKHHLLSNSDSI